MSNKNDIFRANVLILLLSAIWKITDAFFILFCLLKRKKKNDGVGGGRGRNKKGKTGEVTEMSRVEHVFTDLLAIQEHLQGY